MSPETQVDAERFLNSLYHYRATELGGRTYRHGEQLLKDILGTATLSSATIKYNGGHKEVVLIYEFKDKSSLEIERRPPTYPKDGIGEVAIHELINIFRVLP